MKTLNAKRITAVAAGAALLGLGLAFAGSLSIDNGFQIINSNGQPVVQVVVGHAAQPSDGVAAANIAAAIGNLAYTSVPVTATVNATQAASVLHAQVSGSSGYTITNAQVWLNETGATSVSGAYAFSSLIGSVINRAVTLNLPIYTKTLQSSGQYSYPNYGGTISTTASPQASAYSGVSAPVNSTPSYNYNGGGVTFSQFGGSKTSNNDNILALSGTQVPGLLSSSGSYSETEYLWVTGFPVYNQNAGEFTLLSAGGAYQVVFGKPIYIWASNNNYNQATFTMLGQQWTIINATPPSTTATQTTAVQGSSSMYLAQSLVPLTTVYVGQNLTAGAYTVTLTDLGQPNSNGVSTASVNLYYNGVLTNTSQIAPGTTAKFNVSGKTVDVKVNSTFAGLYAYQKWAKMQIFSNVYKVTSGQAFNSTYDKGWITDLWWTNTTSTSGAAANALYSIVIYNASPVTLAQGQSLVFIQQPQAWKLTFVGETLGASNQDPVTLSTTSEGLTAYQNFGQQAALGYSVPYINEPGQLLTVSSGISGAFTAPGGQSNMVTYLLTPYQLATTANAASTASNSEVDTSNVVLAYTNVNGANWITANIPLTVLVTGYTESYNGVVWKPSGAATTQNFQFTSNAQSQTTSTPFFNITGVQLQSNRALPGTLSIAVVSENSLGTSATTLATLSSMSGPAIQTASTSLSYQGTSYAALYPVTGNSVLYSGTGTPVAFTLGTHAASGAASSEYFTYSVNEIAVPGTTSYDQLAVGLYNNTAGVQASTLFIMNYSTLGQRQNATYVPYSGSANSISVKQGFSTERGSVVSSITPTQVVFGMAEQQQYLEFAVGPASGGAITRNYATYGPYGVGQNTNIPNVSIGKVTANVTVPAGAGVTVSGINQVQATPSVTSADQPVWLTGLSSTAPIAVLDTNANPQSNLILVGSGYVNSLSQQLQNSYNVTVSPTSAPIVQQYGANRILVAGYYANQTTAAADQFIQQLYAQASV